jgi:hypothetical protein
VLNTRVSLTLGHELLSEMLSSAYHGPHYLNLQAPIPVLTQERAERSKRKAADTQSPDASESWRRLLVFPPASGYHLVAACDHG